jgi:tetratricopeptide (TPR) repeat protein
MYWHIRGKNITAQDYAGAFLAADRSRAPSAARAGALLTAALGSWMTGKIERAAEEWREAALVAEEARAVREACVAAVCRSTLGFYGGDPDIALRSAIAGVEQSRAHGLEWLLAIGLVFEGMLHAGAGDEPEAHARFVEALEIQQRRGDFEGAGMALSGLASLAANRGDPAETLELYARALASFEEVGDRGEEARILSEMAWTYLASGETSLARSCFFDSVQAHSDIASVRGVGGLARRARSRRGDGRTRRPCCADRCGRRGLRAGGGHRRRVFR